MAENPSVNSVDGDELEIARTEKIGMSDLIIATIIGAIVWLLMTVWAYPGLPPSAWENAAVAAWVRPASHILPGFWTFLVQCVYSIFGVNHGELVLQQSAHVLAGLMAMMAYGVMREVLNFIMRLRPQRSSNRKTVMRIASAVGALAFVFSDSVWNESRCLGHGGIIVTLILAAFETFFLFLRKGRLFYAYACAIVCGLITAESPMGIILPLFFVAFYLVVSTVIPTLESPLFKRELLEVGKWHMTFIYLAVVLAAVMLNCWTFVSHGGLGVVGQSVSHIPIAYAMEYWNIMTNTGSATAWLMWSGVFLVPFVVSIVRFPAASDEERFLPYATGLVFFFCGLIAVSQVSFLSSIWIWTYVPMKSEVIQQLGSFLTAITIACTITVFGVDSICRDHQRLVGQSWSLRDSDEEDEDDDELKKQPTPSNSRLKQQNREHVMSAVNSIWTFLLRRISFLSIPMIIVALMVPGRIKHSSRQMMERINEAIEETVREAKDVDYIFTDGNLDAGIELAAAKRGKRLNCLSLAGRGTAMDVYLRTRGLRENSEDNLAFGFDTAMGLRSWVRDHPERFSKAAVQMGFDIWKREGKKLPTMGGMLSLPAGFESEEERQRGIKFAHDLAERLLAIYSRRGGISSCTDKSIRRAFTDVQWRLARMCKYRSEAEDMAGQTELAEKEVVLAQRLNEKNEQFCGMLRTIEKLNEASLRQLTPREGLHLSLLMADFTMGRVYAEAVLKAEPENPDANFAMGMFYLKENQYSRAERHLKYCLLKRPNEPAIYNNLAMIQMKTERYDAASVNIEKAIKLAPNASAVLDTKAKLEELKAKAGTKEAK